MQKHIQTPWEVIQGMDEMERIYAGKSGSRFCVASVNGKENAAFIVRAVNSHEALLEAAKQVVWKLSHNHKLPDYEGPGRITREDATVRMLVRAISQAEGK